MQKIYLILFISLFDIVLLAQKDQTIITSRKDVPLQGVMNIWSHTQLFAGQEYRFTCAVSGDMDLKITSMNAKIELIEDSKRSTGGMDYVITPIDPGICKIIIGVKTSTGANVTLSSREFSVINYPAPPLYIGNMRSGEIVHAKDFTSLKCMYAPESGIFDTYEIKTWSAQFGEQVFNGSGSVFPKELIDAINQSPKGSFLHLKADLSKNTTGHQLTEGIFIVK